MTDHSVGAQDEFHESEASEASVQGGWGVDIFWSQVQSLFFP